MAKSAPFPGKSLLATSDGRVTHSDDLHAYRGRARLAMRRGGGDHDWWRVYALRKRQRKQHCPKPDASHGETVDQVVAGAQARAATGRLGQPLGGDQSPDTHRERPGEFPARFTPAL
jgi:hypothetical protein